MMNSGYIDFKAIEQVPNKYNIKPEDIKKLKVLDWDKLKKYAWYNEAMKKTGERMKLMPKYLDGMRVFRRI